MRTFVRTSLLVNMFFFLLAAGTLQAQTYKMQSSSEIIVEGTSNIHDWEMDATKKQGSAELETEGNELTGIKSLKVIIPAEGLKSGKGGMDKNTYKALKTDDYKNIEFQLKSVKSIESKGSNKYALQTTGNLKIAGQTKEIPMEFTATFNGSTLELSGEKTIDMTNYKVDPPTAMMGTIKTGEEVTIKFQTSFSK